MKTITFILSQIITLKKAIQQEPPSMWLTNGYYMLLQILGMGTSTQAWYQKNTLQDQINAYIGSSKYAEITEAKDLLQSNELLNPFLSNKQIQETNIKVSIIIPFKNEIGVLITCLESIMLKTTFDNYEIILVNNQSNESTLIDLEKYLFDKKEIQIFNYDKQFNYAAIHNWLIKQIETDYCLLLNNDIEVISSNWIQEMFSLLSNEVSIVGARLLYPDGSIQHDGVWFGKDYTNNFFVRHLNKHLTSDSPHLYMGNQIRFCSAVTAACLLISKENYLKVGGMDEENLPIAFNDVDLCFKIRKNGSKIVVAPNVLLTHFESKSRGTMDNQKNANRELKEFKFFSTKWKQQLRGGDPYVPKYWTIFQGKMSLWKLK